MVTTVKAHIYRKYVLIIPVIIFIIFSLIAKISNALVRDSSLKDHVIYLENNEIRVGVNLDLGGSITYLSPISKDENLINNFDRGRQVQMSFYGGPNSYLLVSCQVNNVC